MNNLNLIANYLFDHPGAQVADITEHLCDMNGVHPSGPAASAQRRRYSQYFNYPPKISRRRRQYVGHLWCETPDGTGWMLTLEGYGYVTKCNVKEKTLNP